MKTNIQWIEIQPGEVFRLPDQVRELRVILGTALVTHGRTSRVVEQGGRTAFGDDLFTNVISPVGDRSVVMSTSEIFSTGEWQAVMHAQYARMAAHQGVVEAELSANELW